MEIIYYYCIFYRDVYSVPSWPIRFCRCFIYNHAHESCWFRQHRLQLWFVCLAFDLCHRGIFVDQLIAMPYLKSMIMDGSCTFRNECKHQICSMWIIVLAEPPLSIHCFWHLYALIEYADWPNILYCVVNILLLLLLLSPLLFLLLVIVLLFDCYFARIRCKVSIIRMWSHPRRYRFHRSLIWLAQLELHMISIT